MLNETPTLLDPRVVDRPPAVVNDDGGLIGGRYRLLHPLGDGGMGRVYLAEDRLLARQVAVKTVRSELSGNDEVRSRIKRECRLHAAIGAHPNIVTLYDTVEENGHIYLVMEYFAGETLADRVAAAGRQGLPLGTALDIVRQILHGLACIHDRDIVHRDIKTANILLKELAEGRYLAKLTDFGIARAEIDPGAMTRLTSLGVQGPGTPAYMAPERIDPQTFGEVCPASDLYAVGIILFELLTGQPPFTGTMTEIFTGHLVQPPALEALPTGLPTRVHAILRTALAKQPGDRYQETGPFLAALAELDPAETVGPAAAVVQAPTLLAVPDERPAPAIAPATVLNPARGRARARIRPTSSSLRRRGLVVAAVLLAVLGGYLGHRQFAGPSSPVPDAPERAAVTAEAPSNPAPDVPVAVSPADPAEPKEGSALEVVEQVRQKKDSEEATAISGSAQRPEIKLNSGRGNEWRVTENRTRRIQ